MRNNLRAENRGRQLTLPRKRAKHQSVKQTQKDSEICAILRELMRACNIPSVMGKGMEPLAVGQKGSGEFYISRTTGLWLPTLSLVLPYGDLLYGPMGGPATSVLITEADYLYWENELFEVAGGAGTFNEGELWDAICVYEEWYRKRRALGYLSMANDEGWWKKIAWNFAYPYEYKEAHIIEYLKKKFSPWCSIDLESDPEVAEWIDCVEYKWLNYGLEGSTECICPDSC